MVNLHIILSIFLIAAFVSEKLTIIFFEYTDFVGNEDNLGPLVR